ncbi:MAG: hypothetical protein NVS4B12_27950 [Ktedonobacteraceae bacterium]
MEVIIFIGPQGAGKSTFYQTHFATTHAYISKDALHSSKTMNKATKQNILLEEALRVGRSIVIDNTNPTKEDREPLIHLGHLYNATVIGYYFDVSVNECLARNKERIGKARVPDKAIYITSRKMALPTFEEGFDTLFCVHTEEDGLFEVDDWRASNE